LNTPVGGNIVELPERTKQAALVSPDNPLTGIILGVAISMSKYKEKMAGRLLFQGEAGHLLKPTKKRNKSDLISYLN
jgi:hypothetical protein